MNDNRNLIDLKKKKIDYSRFAYILLSISVFLYLGIVFQGEQKETLQMVVIFATIFTFLSSAFGFYLQSIRIQRKLSEEANNLLDEEQ